MCVLAVKTHAFLIQKTERKRVSFGLKLKK